MWVKIQIPPLPVKRKSLKEHPIRIAAEAKTTDFFKHRFYPYVTRKLHIDRLAKFYSKQARVYLITALSK